MALEIFKLVGSIFIDNEKANDSLQKTDKKASTLATTMGNAGKVAAAGAAAIGTAVIGAGTALVGMANDAAKSADEIDKASIRMGIGTEQYQELSYAAEQCGVEMATLEGAAKKLEGTDLNFDDAISQIMALETAQERSAMAADLFGEKIAYTLSPLIEQSGEDFEGLKDRAHELGLVMTEEAVKTGVEYGDLSNDLQKSFGMLKTNLGSALFPVLNSVIKKLIEFMPKLQEIGQQIGPIASDFIEKLIPPLAELAGTLLPVLLSAIGEIIPMLADVAASIVPVLVSMFQELTPVLVQIITEVLPVAANLLNLILPIISTILQFLSPILGVVLQLLSPLLELVSAILTPILSLLNVLLAPLLTVLNAVLVPVLNIISLLLQPLTSLLSMILEPLTQLLGALIPPMLEILNKCIVPIMEKIQEAYAWAAPIATKVFDWLKGFFAFVVENLTGGVKTAFEKIGTVVKNVWAGMKNAFKDGVNFWIKAINTFIGGLNKIKVPDWLSSKVGISSVNLSTIPMLAEGGIVTGAGKAMVGEEGPEILDLPRGARVTPLNGDAVGIDYERLMEVFVAALRLVAPEFKTQLAAELDTDGLIRFLVKENRSSQYMTGKGLLEL